MAVALGCMSAMLRGGDAPPTYVIVTDAVMDASIPGDPDPFVLVVQELAQLRAAGKVIPFTINEQTGEPELGPIWPELRRLQPAFVAFVVKPERLEDSFVGAVFEGLTKLDQDPELDAAYGFITGSGSSDAIALVRNTAAAEAKAAGRDANHKPKFVAIAHTFAEADLGPFAIEQGEAHQKLGFQAAGINPIDVPLPGSGEWTANSATEIEKLNGASLVLLAGHGMGDRSCTISGSSFGGTRLDAAVIINGSCHSAVTCLRHDIVDAQLNIGTIGINPRESVCLNFIHAGAVGQIASTASSSWMNVAFAHERMMQGETQGEALQHSQNEKIRAANLKTITILPFRDGKPSPQFLPEDQNPGGLQSISRVILIGDPAFRPFPPR